MDELWVTDGSPGGTRELTDISPSSRRIPANLTNFNGTFISPRLGRTAERASEIRRNDTRNNDGHGPDAEATTVTAHYGYDESSEQNIPQLAASGGTLYFAEGDAAHGTGCGRSPPRRHRPSSTTSTRYGQLGPSRFRRFQQRGLLRGARWLDSPEEPALGDNRNDDTGRRLVHAGIHRVSTRGTPSVTSAPT